ncbi:hypothetical protein HOLDEFILI_00684 [Holdemania filiformis DSM 12042]|uniref:Uncharacterized protein n=1 Tax=Holdemania filiformis DSM 12042 TaxID=545696 RepID=B9Y4F4_9FIRM|nr:hypothetical protein HOLDEFILI_00684 [Holdemania filiformis DSM 12042]
MTIFSIFNLLSVFLRIYYRKIELWNKNGKRSLSLVQRSPDF